MKLLAALFVPMLSMLPSVVGHGFLGQVAIDGNWYAGNVPGNDHVGLSPIRQVSDIGPVKGSSNPDLVCGLNAQNAALVAPANPGSKISFQWSGGAGQKWPHNTGPLMTYMASCGSTTCDKFDPSGAKWFKIDQIGKKDGSTWYQQDIMQGDAFDVVLPQDIPPGGYLIRHEIIALHLAVTMGGAEFYPSCTQVLIGGNGNTQPNPTVSFPGAYNDNDPGIYDPDVFDSGSNYTFPGGPLSNLAATSDEVVPGQSASAPFPSGTAASSLPSPSPAKPSPSGSAHSSATGSPAATAGASAPTPSMQCQLQKRGKNVKRGTNVQRPHNLSRVMHRLISTSPKFF